MSKYIKGFNSPYLKFESGNVTRVINVNEIVEIKYYGTDSAYIYYKSGFNHEVNIAAAKELDDFLMNHTVEKLNIFGNVTDIDMMGEKQTLQEWLEENGQA